MTIEEVYAKYICSNCSNEDIEQCEIRTRLDNTTYCDGYKKGNKLEGYKKTIYRTAKFENCVMPELINN